MPIMERVQRVRSARRHTDAGLKAYALGDLAEAEKEFGSALWFASGLGSDDDIARRAFLNMAVVYIERGKYHEGRQVMRQALVDGNMTQAPDVWEPVPLWGFYPDGDEPEVPAPEVVRGLRRTSRVHSLNPVPALRELAAFEARASRPASASRLLALANAL